MAPLIDYPGVGTMRYFDVLALSLLRGHLDVPCDSLAWEAIIIDGKCYGYYGATPALLRLVLNGVCPSCIGHWPRVMMIAGGLLSYVGCVLTARRALGAVRHSLVWAAAFGVVMSLGSTLLFIVADPYLYHEAILWASALAVLTLWAAGRYADEGAGWALRLSLALLMLTLHARVTVGIAVAVAMAAWFCLPLLSAMAGRGWMAPGPVRPWRRVALAAVVAVMAATPLALNVAKYGHVTPPMDRERFYTAFPERLDLIADGNFRWDNLRCSASLYLSPANIAVTDRFPWIAPGQPRYWFPPRPLPPVAAGCAESHVESLDPSFSLLYAAPAPLILAFIGLVSLVRAPSSARRWGPAIGAGTLAVLAMMAFSSVCFRYEHDFFPLLTVAGALGWARLAAWRDGWRQVAVAGVGLCVLAGFWVNFVGAQSSGSPQPTMFELGRMVKNAVTEPD